MKGILAGFFSIGALGSLAGRGWVLVLVAFGMLMFAIEWVVADPTRMWVAVVLGVIVAWAPVFGTLWFAGRELFRTDWPGVSRPPGPIARLWNAVMVMAMGMVVIVAASILPIFTLGFGCEEYLRGEQSVGAACSATYTLPFVLVASAVTGNEGEELFE